jgi:hypothetical protein
MHRGKYGALRRGGNKWRLQEGAKIRVCLGKGIVVMCQQCKESGGVQRKRSLVLHSFTVRDHTGGIKAEASFTKGEPELYVHERLVKAHGGRCVGVTGNIQNGRGRVFHHGLELGKTAQEGSLPGEGEPRGRSVSGGVGEHGRG